MSSDLLKPYWEKRLEDVRVALENNGFEAIIVDKPEDTVPLVMEKILPEAAPDVVSWGGSATLYQCRIIDALLAGEGYEILHTTDKNAPVDETMMRRREALHADLFLTGSNAVTEEGHLVNLDMIGNRCGGLTYGPKRVVVVAGRNKICSDVGDAMFRIKNIAAPANAMRLGKKTPCIKTGRCMDCKSPERICNVWTINEKSFPAGRITVILVNSDMGL